MVAVIVIVVVVAVVGAVGAVGVVPVVASSACVRANISAPSPEAPLCWKG